MRKKEIPQETVMQEKTSDEEDSPEAGEPTDVLENWIELQRVLNGESVEDLFEKGWKPHIKPKPNGKQYMTFRLHGRDENGDPIDTERGLGTLDPEHPERWNILMGLYEESKPPIPALPSVSHRTDAPQSTASNATQSRSSVLTAKVGRIAPIGPSVNIKLGTLQWYTWVQQACGYPGNLDDFINETVDSYFREHHHLELAVVIQGEEKN